jgi:hypothetical protein
MSALITVDVERDGQDAQRIDIKMRTVLQWEKRFKGRAMAMLNENALKAEYVYELTWIALGTPGELAEFCATTDVTPVDDEPEVDDADPTQTAQPIEP